jgi:hypothetical protein
VCCQSDRYLTHAEEVVKNREHLFTGLVVLFKTGQVQDLLEFVRVIVAEMEQEVITMIGDDWSEESANLIVGNFHSFCGHRVPEYTFPDVVVVLIEVFDNRSLIAALVPIFVLEQRDKVCHAECNWAIVLTLVPPALCFGNADVAMSVVMECQNLFKYKHEVVQIVD